MKDQLISIKDSVLVKSYIQGDERALSELIGRHKSRIFNFILSKVYDRDVAEDIFQDTFIKVINTLKNKRYNEEGKFLSWVMRIAHNLVIDHFRKENRMPYFKESANSEVSIFSTIKDNSLNIEAQISNEQLRDDIRKLIDDLPEDQREVLEMRIYEELNFKEIADATGVSINTALGRMRYALINLRKLMEKYNVSLSQ